MLSLNRLLRSPTGLLVLLVLLGGAWLLTHFSDGDGGNSRSTLPGLAPGDRSQVMVKVDRYVDGDTVKVFYEGKSEYVRYIGVDTPETVKEDTPVECYGEQAGSFNRNAVEGETVGLAFDKEERDQYGRLLAYVYVDGKLLNAEILAQGYGTVIEVPPNTSMAAEFRRIEAGARSSGRGLWGACR